jgi:hypothetical protein
MELLIFWEGEIRDGTPLGWDIGEHELVAVMLGRHIHFLVLVVGGDPLHHLADIG